MNGDVLGFNNLVWLRSGLHAVPRQVSMHVQQLSLQDARVPEVGTTADQISGITLARQYGERGRKELFQTADQTLSADGSRLVGTVWPFLPPLMGNTAHERETPMGVTGALESVRRMMSNEVYKGTAFHRSQIAAVPWSLTEPLPQCGRTRALNLIDLTAGLRPQARQQDRCVWNKLFIHSQSPLTAAHSGLHSSDGKIYKTST